MNLPQPSLRLSWHCSAVFYHQKQRVFLYTDAASSLEVEYDLVPEFRRYLSRFGPEKTISWLTEQYDHIRQHDGTRLKLFRTGFSGCWLILTCSDSKPI
jgi:hypothetical protein